jgi:hypothetical protein
LLPPPTHAITTSGNRPACSSIWARYGRSPPGSPGPGSGRCVRDRSDHVERRPHALTQSRRASLIVSFKVRCLID